MAARRGLTVAGTMCHSRPMADQLMTYAEAADRLSVSRRTLFRMLTDRVIEPVYVPRPSGRGIIPRLRIADVERLRTQGANARASGDL